MKTNRWGMSVGVMRVGTPAHMYAGMRSESSATSGQKKTPPRRRGSKSRNRPLLTTTWSCANQLAVNQRSEYRYAPGHGHALHAGNGDTGPGPSGLGEAIV